MTEPTWTLRLSKNGTKLATEDSKFRVTADERAMVLDWLQHGKLMVSPAQPAARRKPDGPKIHDGEVRHPTGCPRGRNDCGPLARVASPGFESFMCCGETDSAPVPTDRLRLCVLSTHKHGVDVLVNLDERDAIDTASVLLAGLSSGAQLMAAAAPKEESNHDRA